MTATPQLSRRGFFAATSAAALTAGTAAKAATNTQADVAGEEMVYEVQRTEAEWRDRLNKDEFKILREGDTEFPHTSPLVPITEAGNYHCKGCALPVFESNWKVPLDKGWLFFAHAKPTAVLTSIDGPQRAYGMNPNGFANLIEIHCRRCASHLGHHLLVDGEMLYCINGAALTFTHSTS